jgi:hypothetical protein
MLLVICTVVLMGARAWAAPVVDGTKDAAYGPALAVQTVQTGFQDNLDELNAAYGVIDSGRLYLMLTGNVRDIFNRLEIFIDSKPGGQSVYDSAGNDNTTKLDGLVFDTGFTADYHVVARRGDDMGNESFDVDFADLNGQAASGYFDILGGLEGSGATGTGVNASPLQIGYDDSNAAGIGGDAPNAANQAAAAAVLTGFELSIDLVDLGYVGGPIRVMAGINAQNHDFWSNQFLGGLPAPQGNVGGDGEGTFTGEGAIDLNEFRGEQFFTVVPEPPSFVMLALGLVAAVQLARRRRPWHGRS